MKSYPLARPIYYLALAKELKRFIARPHQAPDTTKGTKEKIYDSMGLLLIKLAFSICVALVLGLFYEPENLTDSAMSERFTPLAYLLVGGMILPLFEEVCFRLSLRFHPLYLGLSGAAFAYYLATKVLYRTNLSLVDDSFSIRVIIAGLSGLLLFAIASNPRVRAVLKLFWSAHFRWIYYLSCVSFAWLHIFNFHLEPLTLILLPVITLPQLFSATIAGFLRTSYGFHYPLFLHMATNLLFISISFLPID